MAGGGGGNSLPKDHSKGRSFHRDDCDCSIIMIVVLRSEMIVAEGLFVFLALQ